MLNILNLREKRGYNRLRLDGAVKIALHEKCAFGNRTSVPQLLKKAKLK